ncbi:hypothetical protein [Nostoc sp. DSM 114159]
MTSPAIGQTLGLDTALLIDLILTNTNYLDVTDDFLEAIFCSEFNFVTSVLPLVKCIIYLDE